MHRIDHETAAEDLFGPGKAGFTEGDPDTAIAATTLTADWANAVQEELAAVAESTSTLRKASTSQVLEALGFGFAVLAASSLDERLTVSPYGVASDDQCTIVVISGVASPNPRIFTARNGWDFVDATPGSFVSALRAIEWAPGPRLFVAIGTNGAILTSPDGVAWTVQVADSGYAGTFLEIAVSPARIVLFGDAGEVQTSEDGITWTHRATPGGHGITTNTRSTAWSAAAGKFVATLGAALLTSADGITWVAGSAPPAATMNKVQGSAQGFISLDGSGVVRVSADGETWSVVAISGYAPTGLVRGGWLVGDGPGALNTVVAPSPYHRSRSLLPGFSGLGWIRTRIAWVLLTSTKVYVSRPFPAIGT